MAGRKLPPIEDTGLVSLYSDFPSISDHRSSHVNPATHLLLMPSLGSEGHECFHQPIGLEDELPIPRIYLSPVRIPGFEFRGICYAGQNEHDRTL